MVLCLYAVCSGYRRGDKITNTSLFFWLRWHVMLFRTKLASWNIPWDLRTICSAPEPAWKMKHLGTLQGLFVSCQSFTCCIGTSKTIQRERGERKSGPPCPGTTRVAHTGWVRNESGISIPAASGTWGHLQDQNDTASNLGLKNLVWS